MCLIQENSQTDITRNKVKNILESDNIDFLFIDGDHSYEGVKKVLEQYKTLVGDGGIIAFHDIVANTTYHPDTKYIVVLRFWNEIKTKYKYKEIIENVNQVSMGIGILFV